MHRTYIFRIQHGTFTLINNFKHDNDKRSMRVLSVYTSLKDAGHKGYGFDKRMTMYLLGLSGLSGCNAYSIETIIQ